MPSMIFEPEADDELAVSWLLTELGDPIGASDALPRLGLFALESPLPMTPLPIDRLPMPLPPPCIACGDWRWPLAKPFIACCAEPAMILMPLFCCCDKP